MPSVFAEAFTASLSPLYETMGEDAVYTDSEAWTCNCRVVVNRNLTEYGDVANVQGVTAVIAVRRSEVPDRPRRNDTFELDDGETLRVDRVLTSDDYEHEVLCS